MEVCDNGTINNAGSEGWRLTTQSAKMAALCVTEISGEGIIHNIDEQAITEAL